MKFFRFLKDSFRSLTPFEWVLWIGSLAAIAVSFFAARGTDYLTLSASLLGATSLIFLAKGNVLGQFLVIAFGILYAIVSYSFAYYGEMITYLGMTLPSAVASMIVWLKNSFRGNHTEIAINALRKREYPVIFALAAAVTVAFYFILRALGYALNDVVLIVLWILATIESLSYLPVAVCFAVFLINDFYGFLSWTRIRRRQQTEHEPL